MEINRKEVKFLEHFGTFIRFSPAPLPFNTQLHLEVLVQDQAVALGFSKNH
jgi:hypothetical protein